MDASMRRYKAIKNSDPPKFYEKVMNENKVLYDAFPSVFEMHLEGKLDSTFFEMLKMRSKIEKGEVTEDDASKLIGQKLFDRFVGPVIGTTPPPEKPLSYSEFYKQYTS
jgi:hypothetical protein